MNLISLIVLGLFKLYLSWWMSYGDLCFSKNWCISSKLSDLCIEFIIFPYYLLMSAVSVVISSISFFYISNLSSLFLSSLARGY